MRVEGIQPGFPKAEGTAVSQALPELWGIEEKPGFSSTSQGQEEEDKIRGKEKLLDGDFLKALGEKVEQLNKTAEIFDKRLHFKIHEETERIMVQVIETESGEVLTEVPPEKILDMVARLEEMIGLLIDERV